jgi:hypothetical protein
MVTSLPPSHLRLRWLLSWHAAEHDWRMQCGSVSLNDLQLCKFVFFTSYALAGPVALVSSFLFIMLENYGLQLQHLSPHSLALVAIFVHLCEMFICV